MIMTVHDYQNVTVHTAKLFEAAAHLRTATLGA
jgi:hypothetical protein